MAYYVLSVENKDIYTCRKGIRGNREINLLLISEGGIRHYPHLLLIRITRL